MLEAKIPDEFIAVCNCWAGSMGCMLRAIDSSGGLTIGTIRPYSNDASRYYTDEEWHLSLWGSLCSDIRYYIRLSEKNPDSNPDPDVGIEALKLFLEFAEAKELELRNAYNLEESSIV